MGSHLSLSTVNLGRGKWVSVNVTGRIKQQEFCEIMRSHCTGVKQYVAGFKHCVYSWSSLKCMRQNNFWKTFYFVYSSGEPAIPDIQLYCCRNAVVRETNE